MITIDDLTLMGEIDPSIQEMINLLLEAGYPAVLGIVTDGKASNPNTVQVYKDLAAKGWVLASHSDTHSDLHKMEYDPDGDVRADIRISRQKIAAATGVDTHTLILPYGGMVDQTRLLWKEGIVWAVGINGGLGYDDRQWVHYVGRESPSGTAQQTFENMMERFGN